MTKRQISFWISVQEKEPQKHCEKATIIDAAQCDFKVSFWFDITRLFFIQSTQNILSNGVGLITLRLMVWKWRGSKDNYANQQNTTTTYFYQKTKNLNKVQFSLLCFFLVQKFIQEGVYFGAYVVPIHVHFLKFSHAYKWHDDTSAFWM